MDTVVCTTAREAAYRDASLILAQLGGRSRRAQRVLLERELVRALERAYAFELRERRVAPHRDRNVAAYAPTERARLEPTSCASVEQLRQELVVFVERCRHLTAMCERLVSVSDRLTGAERERASGDFTDVEP